MIVVLRIYCTDIIIFSLDNGYCDVYTITKRRMFLFILSIRITVRRWNSRDSLLHANTKYLACPTTTFSYTQQTSSKQKLIESTVRVLNVISREQEHVIEEWCRLVHTINGDLLDRCESRRVFWENNAVDWDLQNPCTVFFKNNN